MKNKAKEFLKKTPHQSQSLLDLLVDFGNSLIPTGYAITVFFGSDGYVQTVNSKTVSDLNKSDLDTWLKKRVWLMPEDNKTDEQVNKWFEENIDKECSPSTAITKYRLWTKKN